MTLILGISAAIGILIYLLHRQGFAVTKSIAAVLFVFQLPAVQRGCGSRPAGQPKAGAASLKPAPVHRRTQVRWNGTVLSAMGVSSCYRHM